MSHHIILRSRIMIYVLSILFMPMGFLVGIYLITHEDTQYNRIGEMIIELIGIVLVCFVILMLMLASGQ